MSAHAALYTLSDDALPQEYASFMTPQDVLHDCPTAAQCYVPIVSIPAEFSHSEHPGCLHYLPPTAVSTRYYALHDPNVYPDDKPTSVPHPSIHQFQIPSPCDAQSESSFGSPEVDVDVCMTSFPEPPYHATATSAHASFSPDASQQVFSAPSDPVAHGQPDIPKQRRNRDCPGGETGLLAQLATQYEGQMGLDMTLAYPSPESTVSFDGMLQEHEEQKLHVPPAVVPSQWKLGAALDQLRFREYGGDWNTMMAKVTGRPYEQPLPRATSPLSTEDMARFDELKASLGLEDPDRAKTPTPPTTPTSSEADSAHVCPHPMATVRASADAHHNRMVIYSPTTARRIPVRTSPTGTVLQITASKKPYKRGTTVACAFCRRRKIACGGPQEGDEARRCGQCIQRRQPCEFPTPSTRLSRLSPTHAVGQVHFPNAGATLAGPVHVQDFC
ncbi:hypothetical protein C8Q76DRAFT_808899 [Earliella scabrosa]|nr:hypothetical protein C8Q76DRAFT_808899 [Earliella scabrosa]